jgi:hypothetical protein
MRQAEGQQSPEDRAILLNVALAWVRLAQQSQVVEAAKPGAASALPQHKASSEAAAPAA